MNFDKSQDTSQPRRSPIRFPALRVAGQSVDEEITRLSERFNDRLLLATVCIVLTLFEWFRWWDASPLNPWPLTAVTTCILVFTAWAIARHRREIANLRLGREGERTVGHALEELRAQGYKVFHDIPAPNFNIDHVIAGPAGIYTIETKTMSKPLRGNPKVIYDGDSLWRDDGWRMDKHLAQACAQAGWLADLLKQGGRTAYPVRPVVIFPGWWVENVAPKEKHDVWVLNEKALSPFLAHEPAILSSDAVDAVANCLMQYCRFSPSGHNTGGGN